MPKIDVTRDEMRAVRELQQLYRQQGIIKPQKECLAEILAGRRADKVDLFDGLLDGVKGWRFP